MARHGFATRHKSLVEKFHRRRRSVRLTVGHVVPCCSTTRVHTQVAAYYVPCVCNDVPSTCHVSQSPVLTPPVDP